ncbi:Acyl-coenzyme a oxidase, partial [Thalictrum thalictroides]
MQVIDYKIQQSRLFPLLATAYAYRFVGEWLNWLYTDVTQRLQANDFSTLPEAHACTAGLKSLTTSFTAGGIEKCRKLCGGHGYLCSSGLPELFAVYVPACTYEGDNTVLLLQVARFLMKTVAQLGSGHRAQAIYDHRTMYLISFIVVLWELTDKISHMEMIKGIRGHGYYDELVIPIIENTAREGELTESLAEA